MMQRYVCAALALVACLWGITGARAQDSLPRVGAARLGVQFAPLVYSSRASAPAGSSADFEEETFVVGLGNTALGIDIGGVASRGIAVGARFGVMSQSLSYQLSDGTLSQELGALRTTELALLPYAEFLLGRGRTVGFLAPAVGVILSSVKDTDQDGMALESSSLLLGLAITGGVHAFVGEQVSLDPAIAFEYRGGSTDISEIDEELEVTEFRFSVLLGLTVWLGGAAPEHTSPDAPDALAPPSESLFTSGGGALEDRTQPASAAPITTPPLTLLRPKDSATPELLSVTTDLGPMLLTYTSKPASGGTDAALHLTGPLSDQTRYAGCKALVITVDGVETALTPLQHRVRRQARGVELIVQERLRVDAPLELLRAMSKVNTVSLALCDQALRLPPEAQIALVEFLTQHDQLGQPLPAAAGANTDAAADVPTSPESPE